MSQQSVLATQTTASWAAPTERWQWDGGGIVPSALPARGPTILCVTLMPQGHLVQPHGTANAVLYESLLIGPENHSFL